MRIPDINPKGMDQFQQLQEALDLHVDNGIQKQHGEKTSRLVRAALSDLSPSCYGQGFSKSGQFSKTAQ